MPGPVEGGGCLVLGVPGLGGLPGWGSLVPGGAWSGGTWSQGGTWSGGGLVSQHALRQTPPPQRDGYCCERYASYWNALFFNSSLFIHLMATFDFFPL